MTTITGPSYIVDANGNIDFPVLGKINTTDKTLLEFKEEL
jgi:polysaccharide export outer membrane protein